MKVVPVVTAALALSVVVVVPQAASAAPDQRPAGDVPAPRLHVRTIESRDLPGYVRFSTQEGWVTGVRPSAARRINHVLEDRVAAATAYVTREPQSQCPNGASACGVVIQRLRSVPCVAHTLCVEQIVGSQPPGSNDTEEYADTVAFDTHTGRVLRLSQFVPAPRTAAFLRAVNAGIQAQLKAAGVDDPATWGKPVTMLDIHAWLPRANGVQVSFGKYAVAPGSFGIVTVSVPWSVLRR